MLVENAIINSIIEDVLYNPHASTRHSYSYCEVESEFDVNGEPIAIDLCLE